MTTDGTGDFYDGNRAVNEDFWSVYSVSNDLRRNDTIYDSFAQQLYPIFTMGVTGRRIKHMTCTDIWLRCFSR